MFSKWLRSSGAQACVNVLLAFAMTSWLVCYPGPAGGQVARPRKHSEPVTKPVEKIASPTGSEQGILIDGGSLRYSAFYANPCAIVTRDELETILKRSDDDRALVRVGEPGWISNVARCAYSVQYERRIFPELPADNLVRISIDFDNKYAKQGQLLVDPLRDQSYFGAYPGLDIELEIVTGLGDEALYARDKSRFKYEEKSKSTAGASPSQSYLNMDSLYVRRKELVLRFQVAKIVAGGSDPKNVIQIARKALERVP